VRVLGIETSCDETAAAVVDDRRRILSSLVLSQLEEHRPYAGVVPEIAARSHLDHLDQLIAKALEAAGCGLADIDAVAATGGPGLIGGVMVGVIEAKAIAAVTGKPFVAVNHLEGHALTPRLSDGLDFPYLLLLVSGGHTQLLIAEGVGRYRLLGSTLDDALGEAFDKCAKLMGLPFPGGPNLERAAAEGRPGRFSLPRPMKGREGCDFSFSGLKTAVRQAVDSLPPGDLSPRDVADLAADFQQAAAEALTDRARNAIAIFKERHGPAARHFVAAGGVAANRFLAARLTELAAKEGLDFRAPPAGLCTDNAAMIAWAGLEVLREKGASPLNFRPRPRWPLDEG
jgi:N6-L-threonylcarbamoyladenine synthase